MAATTTTGFPVSVSAPAEAAIRSGAICRRRISPQAGRALVTLGHAIEYLTDELVHEGGSFSSHRSELQAVQMLMAVNRKNYFECPEVPPLGKRILSLLHLQAN